MKKILKVIFLSIVSTLGVLGVVIGGMFLFGGFDEKPVYAENLQFNSQEVISSSTFSLQVNTTTENVNQKKLRLYVSAGGEKIINFPDEIIIGKPFSIMPKFNNETKSNVGGFVELSAAYDGEQSNQGVICSCKILIDVPVKNVSFKIREENLNVNIGTKFPIIHKGTLVKDVLNIEPSNALAPYVDRSLFGQIPADSIFRFEDKKLFFEIRDRNNQLNSAFSNFVSSSKLSKEPRIEIKYEYSPDKADLVFSEDIFIEPMDSMGEGHIYPYLTSLYENQINGKVSIDTYQTTTNKGNPYQFVVMNYTIDSLKLSNGNLRPEEKLEFDVYYDEDLTIYLNNPNAGPGTINLGLLLGSDSGITVEDALYKNNIYIGHEYFSVADPKDNYKLQSTNDKLTKLNGNDESVPNTMHKIKVNRRKVEDKEEIGKPKNIYDELWAMNVNYLGISENRFNWCWKYKYTDFMKYYSFKGEPNLEKNKLKFIVVYDDGMYYKEVCFYLKPKIREVEKIIPVDNKFNITSGNKFLIDNSYFNVSGVDGKTPSFQGLDFYIPYTDVDNKIVTIPQNPGNYEISFSFKLTTDSEMIAINKNKNGELNYMSSTKIIFSQLGKTYTWQVDQDGNATGDQISFKANEQIEMRTSVVLKQNKFTERLFTLEFTNISPIDIDGEDVKFYPLNEQGSKSPGTLPFLMISDVIYTTEFEFFKQGKSKYIHILRINNVDGEDVIIDSTLSGIGHFQIEAQWTVQHEGKTYWLGKSCFVKVNVYEHIKELQVYDWKEDGTYAPFSALSADYRFEEGKVQRTIYVTSPQIKALTNAFNEGLLEISFYQKYLSKQFEIENDYKFDPSKFESRTGISLSDLNKDAITFSQWEAVKDRITGNIQGYTVTFTINNIYSIEVSDQYGNPLKLDNKFNIVVSANNYSDIVKGSIIYQDGNQSTDELSVEIVDKVYDYVELSYDNTTVGDSIDTAIQLKASIDASSGNLQWSVNGSEQNKVTTLNKLSYGFKYKKTDGEVNISRLRSDMSAPDFKNPLLFYEFTSSVAGGGLTFKNVPYKEDGIIFIFKVNCEEITQDSASNKDIATYKWIDGTFKQVVNPNLRKGREIFFKLTGLDIQVKAVKKEIEGFEAKNYVLFGDSSESPIFEISGPSHINAPNIDYSKFFSTSIVGSVQDFSKSKGDKKLVIDKNFIANETLVVTLYYGDPSNHPLNIMVNGKEETSYKINVTSAFEINYEKSFNAPSNEPVPFVKSIIYMGDTLQTNAIGDKVEFGLIIPRRDETNSQNIEYNKNINNISIEQGTNKLMFKTIRSSFLFDLIITVRRLVLDETSGLKVPDIGSEKNILVKDIQLSSYYKQEDLTVGKKEDLNDPMSPYVLMAGSENQLKMEVQDEIVLGGDLSKAYNKDKIVGIKVNFLDKETNLQPVYMRSEITNTGKPFVSVYSCDLNIIKFITVTFTFIFDDGGDFVIEKDLKILPNLEIKLKDELYTRVSGQTINLGTVNDTYIVIRNGEIDNENKVLKDTDFTVDDPNRKYNADENFVYDKSIFFNMRDKEENINSILFLKVDYLLNEGEPSITKNTTITFKYETDGYILEFNFDITVILKPTGV